MVYYNDKNHTYFVDGIQVPSVTGLLHFIYPDKYKGISSEVLSNKASYGTEVHELIEKVNNDNVINPLDAYSYKCSDPIMTESLISYINLKNKYKFKPLRQELIVYNRYVAGRFDLLSEMNQKKCLMDYKTTYSLDRDYLSWQLSIYNFLNQEDKADELYAIWVPKRKETELVQIDFKTDEEIVKLIKDYYLQEKNQVIEL